MSKYSTSLNLIIMFSGVFNIIFGTAILSHLIQSLADYNRWLCGIGIIVTGLITTVYGTVKLYNTRSNKVVNKLAR
jgi:hypothetical protein